MNGTDQIAVVSSHHNDFPFLSECFKETDLFASQIIPVQSLEELFHSPLLLKSGLIFLDQDMLAANDRDAFRKVNAVFPYVPIIILSDAENLKGLLEIIKDGAVDYLIRGEITKDDLLRSVQYSIERKQYLNDLKKNSDRFSMITKTTKDAVWEWDIETSDLWSNENHQHLYGLSATDNIPTFNDWIQRIHPDDRERMIKLQEDVLASKSNVFLSEYRFLNIKGQYKYIFDRCYIVRNAEGNAIRMAGSMMDVTHLKKAEEELKESFQSIRNLSTHLQNQMEKERTKIARKIHDDIGQQLSALKLDLSWVNKNIDQFADTTVLHRMDEIIKILNQSVTSVRRISFDLRPGLLDDLGLIAAVEWQLDDLEKLSGIKTRFIYDDPEIEIPAQISTGIFRIFQESLVHVSTHDRVTELNVTLSKGSGFIKLSIADNGQRINDNDQQKTGSNFEILAIQERTRMLSGEYTIKSLEGEGTEVELIIPVE